MKTGKVPENVLKRSILKKTGSKRSEVLIGAGVGTDCACVDLGASDAVFLSSDPVTVCADNIGLYAVHSAVNNIAASGAEPVGILVTELLPTSFEEDDIKVVTKDLDEACKALKIQILGGHTEITEAVNRPVLSITAVGKAPFEKKSKAHPGDDVVIT